ncbi:FAU ubiquitin-like and ribosomal protein S30 [Pseudolycoriella hygida]|uniref:FAU ubiquitin-like and ribosomal protein S30 n=1 Tax=Pseudolycoriella hygida TaxID=35572 RepID=A0A9Q0MS37_9DIPT|nr:FAU ubiquitin-like and ribosomal protein S30 [Pseudolycoriella hygida]
MHIFIRGLETHVLEAEPFETVDIIKERVSGFVKISADEFQLSCEGKILESGDQLASLSSYELDLTVPLLGGKVHGSLARAGKVKGQTPKVEKQEKKKKKTGRAKRRIQYNRRFVNVVQSFGRRRGPNANSS